MSFPGGIVSKETACKAKGMGSVPGSEDYMEKEMAAYSVMCFA